MKVLFFGTPQIAVPFLDWLIQHEQVVGVVCRPDEPVGRGMTLTSPPTKLLAQRHHIPVYQPTGKWTPGTLTGLKNLGADIGIVVAYGRIMPKAAYMAPKLGSLNVHFSLLPKYRGAAPMQWALINGDKETGVSTFWLEEAMDAGPIFRRDPMPIEPQDDAATLKEKLVALGLKQLEAVFTDLAVGHLIKEPQKGAPTLAPQLKKEDGKIDWKKSSDSIVQVMRGVFEWPGAFTRYQGKTLKVIRAVSDPSIPGCKYPGKIIAVAKKTGIMVEAGGGGAVCLQEVQPEGKKPMDAWAFWQGAHMKVGDEFE